jgi:hypothetical protein
MHRFSGEKGAGSGDGWGNENAHGDKAYQPAVKRVDPGE